LTESCQKLSISQRTLYRRIDKGEIESKLENGKRWVLAALPDNEEMAELSDNLATVVDTEEIERFKQEITGLEQSIKQQTAKIAALETANDNLRSQITEKDHQIADLHRVIAVAQNQAHQLIERMQMPFWRRWLKQKALPAPGDVMNMEPGKEEADTRGENEK